MDEDYYGSPEYYDDLAKERAQLVAQVLERARTANTPDTSPLLRDVPLSLVVGNALEAVDIRTVRELSRFTKPELLYIRGLGPGRIKEIQRVLTDNGYRLAFSS